MGVDRGQSLRFAEVGVGCFLVVVAGGVLGCFVIVLAVGWAVVVVPPTSDRHGFLPKCFAFPMRKSLGWVVMWMLMDMVESSSSSGVGAMMSISRC